MLIISEIKQSLRNIFKNYKYWIINFLGFSISITIILLTAAYALFQYKTDSYHKNADRIAIVSMDNKEQQKWVGTPWYLAQSILPQIPQIQASCRIFKHGDDQYLRFGNNESLETELSVADSSVADIFTFKCLSGDIKTALKEPMSLVLTESEAWKHFGKQNPVGKQLLYNSDYEMTVNAVIEDLPKNSIFSFAGLISSASMDILPVNYDYKDPGSYNHETFVLLNTTGQKEIIATAIGEEIYQVMRFDNRPYVKLISLKELFFSTNTRDDFNHGNKRNIFILFSIAFAVLFLAIINFINLEWIRFSQKAKGLFIRKIVGIPVHRIILIILIESVIISLSATIVAVLISNILFYLVDGANAPAMFDRSVVQSADYLLMIVIASVLIGIIAGLPSVFIVLRNNVYTLKDKKFTGAKNGKLIQQSLVVFQFVIAVALIIYTLGIFRQQKFLLNNYDIGFDKEKILSVRTFELSASKNNIMEDRLMSLPDIEAAAFCFQTPGEITQHWEGIRLEIAKERKTVGAYIMMGSENITDVFDLEIKHGRVDNTQGRNMQVIINETAMKEFGIMPGEEGSTARIEVQDQLHIIDAVCSDFNFQSLHQIINPMIILTVPEANHRLLVKINASTAGGIKNVLSEIKNVFNNMNPGKPFEYTFLDDKLAGMYQNETENFSMLCVATIAAIVIALLGLYGLSVYIISYKIKEIGIRKVNGATISEIMLLLNSNFVKWVSVSFVIAIPIAYYAINKWLENFAYKTTLSWWIFALAGLLALGIAFLTVSWQSWRAATRNPVEALRYE